MGIIVLTVLMGAAMILASCTTYDYPESPIVEFDYDHCILHTTEEAVACEVTIHPPRAKR